MCTLIDIASSKNLYVIQVLVTSQCMQRKQIVLGYSPALRVARFSSTSYSTKRTYTHSDTLHANSVDSTLYCTKGTKDLFTKSQSFSIEAWKFAPTQIDNNEPISFIPVPPLLSSDRKTNVPKHTRDRL